MKTKKLKAVLIMVTILACISTICFATDNTPVTTNENTTTNETNTTEGNTEGTGANNEQTVELEEHPGDYFEIGNAVNINKAVDGNAFIMGGNITISGQINGDLYVLASSSLTIDYGSAIYGNVFVVAPNVTLDGVVYSLYAVTDNFVCKYNGMAALDLKVLANTIDFAGYIERHVYFSASKSMTFQEDACVLGNLNYAANNVNISENATIKGETYASDFSSVSAVATPAKMIANYTISFITSLTFLLVVLLAILLVKPSIIQNTAKHLTEKPWKTLGLGALAFILIPILAALFIFIKALSSVALVLATIYFILLALSTIIVTIGLAKFLDNKIQKTHSETSILAYVIIVGIVLWALSQIPYLGIFVSLAVWIFGLGTIIVSLLTHKTDKKVEVKEEKEIKKEKTLPEKPVNEEKENDKKEEKDSKDDKEKEDK